MVAVEGTKAVDPNNQPSTNQVSLGEMLATARNVKKLTQQDVSNSLRFSVKQIDALENNVFDALPDAVITRGFIRNYARFLEIDAEPLLASYHVLVPTESPETLVVKSSMRQVELTKESLPWLQYILGSILVLLFLLAWFFYMDHMPNIMSENAAKVAAGDAPAVNATPLSLPEIALPAAQREEGLNVAEDESTTVNADASTTLPQETQALNEPVLALTTKKVTMSFSEETWVRVSDKSGKVIYAKLQAAGSEDSFDATPPFDLVIGNAKAAKLIFSGEPVDLTAYTKNNVARVTLE